MISRAARLLVLLVGSVVLGYLGLQKYFDWLTAELPESRTRLGRPASKT